MARYEFMQETLVEILRGLSGVQVVASADVFSACRSLKYQLREAERVAGVQQQGVADAHVAAMRAAQLAAERVRGTPPLMPTVSDGLPPAHAQHSFTGRELVSVVALFLTLCFAPPSVYAVTPCLCVVGRPFV